MASRSRRDRMKKVPLSEIKDDLSRYLRIAEKEEVVITRHGKPAGILIGFESEEDWFDYRLENDPRFLSRIEKARQSLQEGRGVPIEKIKDENFRPDIPLLSRRDCDPRGHRLHPQNGTHRTAPLRW